MVAAPSKEKIKALFGELRGASEVPAIPAPGDLGELSAGLEDVGDADGLPRFRAESNSGRIEFDPAPMNCQSASESNTCARLDWLAGLDASTVVGG